MEKTCTRCHQPVSEESCYCPACGLPQLVYPADGASAPPSSEHWPEAVRDASSIDWKTGMRAALALAVPAGLLSSGISPLAVLGIFWVAGAAAWAVVLYVRSQRPAWITAGAGARIGLVTGLITAWLAFGVSGADLFVARVFLHQGNEIDSTWRQLAEEQLFAPLSVSDHQTQVQVNALKGLVLSPEGHAGFQTLGLASLCSFLVLFAVAGGAFGARMVSRSRRPEI
jgi:hypothetical protein